MKKQKILLAAVLAATLPCSSATAASMEGMAGMRTMQQGSMTAEGHGVVRKVSVHGDTVTIAHEPIKALGWPSMVMDFKVNDTADLARLKPGQHVAFEVVQSSDGNYAISHIAVAKQR